VNKRASMSRSGIEDNRSLTHHPRFRFAASRLLAIVFNVNTVADLIKELWWCIVILHKKLLSKIKQYSLQFNRLLVWRYTPAIEY